MCPQSVLTTEPWASNLDLWHQTRSAAPIRTSTPAGTPPGSPPRLALTTKALGMSQQPGSSSCCYTECTAVKEYNICSLLSGVHGSPSLTTSISGSRLTWRRWVWCLASSPRAAVMLMSGSLNTASSTALWTPSTGSTTKTRQETTG